MGNGLCGSYKFETSRQPVSVIPQRQIPIYELNTQALKSGVIKPHYNTPAPPPSIISYPPRVTDPGGFKFESLVYSKKSWQEINKPMSAYVLCATSFIDC